MTSPKHPYHYPAIGDYLKSDLGRATALDQHVNRPGDVHVDVAKALDLFYLAHPKVSKNPSELGDSQDAYERENNRSLRSCQNDGFASHCVGSISTAWKNIGLMRFTLEIRNVTINLCALLSLAATSGYATEPEQRFDFSGHAALIFSVPMSSADEKNFGKNWRRETYLSSTEKRMELLPMEYGEAVFAKGYPPQVSPSGKYAVLDVLRVGMVESGPNAAPESKSRQYCPVLDTASGCIISMQTGELCGGQWDTNNDTWIVGGMDKDDIDHGMLSYSFDGANVLWQEYLVSNRSKLPYSLKAALKDNLGVVNMLACEPPKSANKDSYVKIARQLAKENDEADAKYIETSLAEAPPDNDPIPISMIVLDKAPLYELPDETYETRMYLVKGDQVILLDTMKPNWVLIKYIEKKGEAILKWVKADTVKLPE